MPWKERTVMDKRSRFLAEAISKERSFSAVCRAYGISRKTGYKWLHRYETGQALSDKSRAPRHRPHKTAPEIEQEILRIRTKHPGWGPRKLLHELSQQVHTNLPSKSTVENILKRNGRITPEASEAATPYTRFERERPNELWQMDFKGDFALLDGQRCYPFDILDDCSRYGLTLHANRGTSAEEFVPLFTHILEEYGLPDAILCDNGKPWGDSKGGITQFDVWMMRLGVLPIHGRPLHPQTQGKLERFHRTMKDELLRYKPLRNAQQAQAEFDAWLYAYNNERAHEALGLRVPAAVYRPSKRTLLNADRPVEYDTGSLLYKVNYKGYISIRKHRYYLTEALIGEYLQLNDLGGHLVGLQYGDFEIAQIDLEQQMIVSKRRRRVR